MGFVIDLRRRALHVLPPALALLAIVYFAFHAVHGDRGVLAWRHLEQKVDAKRLELEGIRAQRQVLEHRVGLLTPSALDADMLDEASRKVLGFGQPDEIVIYTAPSPTAAAPRGAAPAESRSSAPAESAERQ